MPADNKWFTRLVVWRPLVRGAASLDLAFPKVDDAKRKELEEVRKALK